MEKISVIIVTKDRPEKLYRSCKSIRSGIVLPNQIVIIDNGENHLAKNKILFDDRFSKTGEDLDICLKIFNKKGEIYFHNKLVVYDESRTTLQSFIKQWYGYGSSKYHYFRVVLHNGRVKKTTQFVKAFFESVPNINFLIKKNNLIFGVFLALIFHRVGFIAFLLKNFISKKQ